MPIVLPRPALPTIVWMVVMIVMAWTGRPTSATDFDRVWYEPPAISSARSDWLPRQLEYAAGTITRFDAEQLEIDVIGQSKPTVVPAERVVWIEPKYTSELGATGMREFADRRFPEAVSNLFAAIEAGPDVWEQQWLTAHLALSAKRVEKYTATLNILESWGASKPPAAMLGLLPIEWTARPVTGAAITAARSKLGSPEPIERLVAASWLLSSPDDQVYAQRILDTLASDRRDRAVSQLAEAVSWRKTPVPKIANQVDGWLKKIDAMPISLQAGPLMLVADRLRASNDLERAKEIYLNVSLLHQNVGLLADEAKAELIAMEKQ